MRRSLLLAFGAVVGCNGILGIEEPVRDTEQDALAGAAGSRDDDDGQGGSNGNGGTGNGGSSGSGGSGGSGGGSGGSSSGSGGAGGSGGDGGSEQTITCGGLDQACCDVGEACTQGLGCGVDSAVCVRCGFFEGMGPGFALVQRISADGTFVAANVDRGMGQRAERWSREAGAIELRPNTAFLVLDMSADGAVVVGGQEGRALRWTDTGVEDLGNMPVPMADGVYSSYAVNADGSVISGVCSGTDGCPPGQTGGFRSFRWTPGSARSSPPWRRSASARMAACSWARAAGTRSAGRETRCKISGYCRPPRSARRAPSARMGSWWWAPAPGAPSAGARWTRYSRCLRSPMCRVIRRTKPSSSTATAA